MEVTEIFRTIQYQQESDKEDKDPKLVGEVPKPDIKEYAFKHSLGWEEIRGIKEYMYPDDWLYHKGPKFYIKTHGQADDILVLGNYRSMSDHWAAFRNKHPLFGEKTE